MNPATPRGQTSLPGAVLGLVLWLLPAWAQGAGTLEPYSGPTPTPAFSLPDTDGETHALADYRGRVVLVNFWATWCPPCIKEMPSLQRLQALQADRPFQTLAVNVGEKRYKVRKFTRLVDFTLPVLLDEHRRTFDAWDCSVLPTSFLLDARGRIRYRVQGDTHWDTDEVIALIDGLIAETEAEKGSE